MNKIPAIFFTVVSLLFFLGCRTEASEKASKAEEAGRKAAKVLLDSQPMTEMKLENFLLEIKSNENSLRRAGFDEAANRYIEYFEAEVIENSDSLAAIIFPISAE